MAQNWNAAEEQRKINNIDSWNPILKAHKIPTPALIDGERLTWQRKRIMDKVRHVVSDELQKIPTDDMFDATLDDCERRFMQSAAQEAVRPSKVPEGSLKEVVSYDASGRVSYSYFGSPKAWLADFSHPRKKLLSIINPDADKFRKL
jgi:hypothetical protein